MRMAEKIRHHQSAPTEVSLGANETCFVRFADGDYDYGLLTACSEKYEELTRDGHNVSNVILSPGGLSGYVSSWLIRHT